MPRTATERAGLRTIKATRATESRQSSFSFYAVEGSVCVQIEADSEEDARFLCRDLELDFVGCCTNKASG